jgi:hypothetical protein
MKIIFFNVWGNRIKVDFLDYLKNESETTDIFCFQETTDRVRKYAKSILTDYTEIFSQKFIKENVFLQGIYIKKSVKVKSFTSIMTDDTEIGLGLIIHFIYNQNNIYLANIHGISQPGNKLDTPPRLRQSQFILKHFSKLNGYKIIGGDFNADIFRFNSNLFVGKQGDNFTLTVNSCLNVSANLVVNNNTTLNKLLTIGTSIFNDITTFNDTIILNSDLIHQNREKGAIQHYQNHGKKENYGMMNDAKSWLDRVAGI